MARKAKQRRKKTGAILVIIAFVFAASIPMRLLDMNFEFIASAEASDPDAAVSEIGPTSPLRAALDEVEALRNRLAEREVELDYREQAVEAAQALVETRLAELEAAEIRLRELVEISDEAAENDLTQLTAVYQSMPPDQAAELFSQMDPSFAAGFLSRMGPDASAAIMAELEPSIAYAISIVIATRNAGAPTLPDQEDPDTES